MCVRACVCVGASVRASVRACNCLRAMHEYSPQSTVGDEFPIAYIFYYQYKYESMNFKTFNLFYYFIKKFKITCSHRFLINK